MSTVKIYDINGVAYSFIKTNPPTLLITANGHTVTGGYTNIRIEPRLYLVPPADGIWEFDFMADAPSGIVNQLITPVVAEYEWKNFPKNIRGVKVYADKNAKTVLFQKDIELIKATAWVNIQPIQPTPGGTLIVSVDYNSNQHGFHNLQPVVPQGINEEILLLEITDSTELIFIFNPRHNSYSQALQNPAQYSSIELIYRGDKIGSIDHIPIVS